MYRNGVHTNTSKSVYDAEEERNSITKKKQQKFMHCHAFMLLPKTRNIWKCKYVLFFAWKPPFHVITSGYIQIYLCVCIDSNQFHCFRNNNNNNNKFICLLYVSMIIITFIFCNKFSFFPIFFCQRRIWLAFACFCSL